MKVLVNCYAVASLESQVITLCCKHSWVTVVQRGSGETQRGSANHEISAISLSSLSSSPPPGHSWDRRWWCAFTLQLPQFIVLTMVYLYLHDWPCPTILCTRRRHTLFSLPYFMPSFDPLLWRHWERGGTNNWGAKNVLEVLVYCTWVIMLKPDAQKRGTKHERDVSC